MVILPLAAIVVVLAVLGGSALLRAASTRRGGLLGGTAMVVTAAGALAVVAVAAVVGIGRGHTPPQDGGPPETTVEEDEVPAEERAPIAALGGRPVAPDLLGPVVQMAPRPTDEDGFPPPERAVDRLDEEVVLQVRATGFEPLSPGTARQCIKAATTSCGNAIDVQFDGAGRASFQYLVVGRLTDAPEAGRCRAADPPCYLVVEGDERAEVAEVRTVFGGELPPPGRIDVSPRRRLADGTVVTVTAEGFPAGERLHVALCAAPATSGTRRCGDPGPATQLVVGPDGRGSAPLALTPGSVGSEGAQCGDGAVCGVSVTTTHGRSVGVVPVSFASPPGADVDPTRLALGLAVAAALALVVVALVRRTDWSPLGEEAAPEIDDAEYADLDAIVAALPSEEDAGDGIASSAR